MGESPLNANPSDSRNKSASSSNKHDAQYVNITDLMHPYHPNFEQSDLTAMHSKSNPENFRSKRNKSVVKISTPFLA